MDPKAKPIDTPRGPHTRLDRACRYLEGKWFPISDQILDRIQASLKESTTETNPSQLLEIITKDYGLALFCFKEVCKRSPSLLENIENPIDVLEGTSPAVLHQILQDGLPSLRLHSLEHSKEQQIGRLREAIIALVTTRTLCEQEEIDPDLGASVSMFRQLGYLLIAWNYPTIYEKAAAQADDQNPLEDLLIRSLGFSPATLALSLAEKWKLTSRFVESSGLNEHDDTILSLTEVGAVARSASSLCEVGEKLARASNPELYPSALHDWELAKDAIEKSLGEDGLKILDEAIAEECESLFVGSPYLFKAGTLVGLESALTTREKQRLANRNPYIGKCTDPVRRELEALYELLTSGQKAEQTVPHLLRRVLPKAGFISSALFTLDPGTKKLALQMKAGEIRLRRGPGLQDIAMGAARDIIPLAFHSADVLASEEPTLEFPGISCLATFFGCSQRFGVFYVEIPHERFASNKDLYQEHLRALSFTLNDCLELH